MTKRIPARPATQSDDALQSRLDDCRRMIEACRSRGVLMRDAVASALYQDRVRYHGADGASSWAAERMGEIFPAPKPVVFGKRTWK